jgi:hypothetical protein
MVVNIARIIEPNGDKEKKRDSKATFLGTFPKALPRVFRGTFPGTARDRRRECTRAEQADQNVVSGGGKREAPTANQYLGLRSPLGPRQRRAALDPKGEQRDGIRSGCLTLPAPLV